MSGIVVCLDKERSFFCHRHIPADIAHSRHHKRCFAHQILRLRKVGQLKAFDFCTRSRMRFEYLCFLIDGRCGDYPAFVNQGKHPAGVEVIYHIARCTDTDGAKDDRYFIPAHNRNQTEGIDTAGVNLRDSRVLDDTFLNEHLTVFYKL
ncbi:hypothetical protein SDC9_194941 [bioreactor metagenome]|uniref:Uncharacterized protein n=1 Tax=bioreactor metagenome TaxID=1076179 RepID=A0A645IA78_9ZZZZ